MQPKELQNENESHLANTSLSLGGYHDSDRMYFAIALTVDFRHVFVFAAVRFPEPGIPAGGANGEAEGFSG